MLNTVIVNCLNYNCEFNCPNLPECKLKGIDIGEKGQCEQYKPKETKAIA